MSTCILHIYFFFYQSAIIAFLQTKTNNKKRKKITQNLPFSCCHLKYSGNKGLQKVQIIRFIRFIADVWNELKFKDSSNFKKQKLTTIYPYFKRKNFQNALILLYN